VAALTTVIDGETTHRTDILSKTQEIIKTFIADNKDNIGIEDVSWMIKFFNLKIIPDDTAAAVFMSNPVMKRAVMRDPDANIAMVNFLRKKKIITDDGVAPWAAAADGDNT
jgi:hypothetical protein